MTENFQVCAQIEALQESLSKARLQGKKIGLVPTMGALHEGHLALVDEAKRISEFVVITIFVNPTQFAPGEDLDKYPRDLEGDFAKLKGRGVDLVFTPSESSVYPEGFCTIVRVSGMTDKLCGISRPHHFQGVTTVVSKLFNMVGPCKAVFGRKDYQQLQVIKRMAKDLNMPVEVVGIPTFREPDGLAMSSRNVYLSSEERKRALSISSGLAAAHKLFAGGERSVDVLRGAVESKLNESALEIDYVATAHPDTLELISKQAPDRLLIAVAAQVGPTRLIDNTVLGEDEPPVRQV